MKILQLFRKHFSEEDLKSVLKCYNIQSLDQSISFTRKNMIEYGTIEKLEEIKHILQEYYLPCKYKVYVSRDININSAINILRQICRLHDSTLRRYTKDVNKEKIVFYIIVKNGANAPFNMTTSTSNILVEFD